MTAGKLQERPGSDPLALPFDQYQRYRLVADLLERLRGGARRKPLRVLDVGGRTAVLRRFLPRERITLVDVEPSEEEGLVLGDGGRLPFQDDAFDVVTAFDTLEHVPPERREAFVAECARVARRWVVLAGPYHAERVAEAEELLDRFLLEKLGVEHRYLREHRSNGLPDRAATERQLTALGARVASIGHGNLDRWLVLMCATMYLDDDPALRELAQAFNRFYNASLYASDHAEPVYRHVVLAALGGAELPEAEGLLDPPVAPEGALKGFEGFTRELLAFDRERGEWRAERERLRKIARDLEEDLAGHRAGLAEARAEARELGRVRSELEQDLGGHRERLSTLSEDLAGHRDSLESAREELSRRAEALRDLQLELDRERRVGAESRKTLARDLAEHREVLARRDEQLSELRALAESERAQLERQLEEHREVLAAREAELVQHREVLAARDAELVEHREVLAARDTELAAVRGPLTAELAEHRRTIEALQAVVQEKDQGVATLTAEVRRLEAMAGEIQEQLLSASGRVHELNVELAEGRRERDAARAELATARAELAARRAEIENLRAALRDRWKSLKRALSPGRPPS